LLEDALESAHYRSTLAFAERTGAECGVDAAFHGFEIDADRRQCLGVERRRDKALQLGADGFRVDAQPSQRPTCPPRVIREHDQQMLGPDPGVTEERALGGGRGNQLARDRIGVQRPVVASPAEQKPHRRLRSSFRPRLCF